MFKSTLLVSFLGLNLLLAASEDPKKGAEDGVLPILWPAIRQDKSYRLMFQLQMFGSAERLNVEEWASFDKQMFRLDLITNESRTTYLTNGKTGEVFRYKPFVCDRLSLNSKELGIIGNLFMGYGIKDGASVDKSGETLYAYGLGPLWLRAKQDAKKVVKMAAGKTEYKRHKFLNNYDGYQLSFENSEVTYDLRMYWPKESYRFLDSVEWLNPEKSNKVSHNPDTVEARAKLMYVDESPVPDSVFELPIGYGCKRTQREESEHAHDKDEVQELLHGDGPNQALLEITLSQPRDQQLNSWISQRNTVNMIRGSITLNEDLTRSYFVTIAQGIDPKTSKWKRMKRVWHAPDPESSTGPVYSIDMTTGECQYTRMEIGDMVKLRFPMAKTMSDQGVPVFLDIDLIRSFLNDNKGFHRLRGNGGVDGETTTPISFIGDVYEKRLTEFKLLGPHGSITWTGPLSIVKKIKSVKIYQRGSEARVKVYHTTITLFFFSEDLTQIRYKAVLDVVDHNELDMSTMQKELDVGACFTEDKKEQMVIKYPVESPQVSQRLAAIENIVRERFVTSILSTTTIQPLQISNLEFSFDNFFMYAKMTLVDLPLTLVFDLERGKQLKRVLDGNSNTNRVIEKLASSLEKCAASCDFYECYRFSYDFSDSKCVLELTPGAAKTVINYSSELYQYAKPLAETSLTRYNSDRARTHLKPHQMLEIFRAYMNYDTSEDGKQAAPLKLSIDTELIYDKAGPTISGYVALKPISIHTDLDSINEFVREEQTNYTSDLQNSSSSSMVRVEEAPSLRVQYSIFNEGRAFNEATGQHFEKMSYDECMEMCETNDCRSFSHCELQQTCKVTKLHESADIQRASHSDSYCSIHILDYLSKFEDFGRTAYPPMTQAVTVGYFPEDCAIACMEHDDFNCQGFYFCKRSSAPINTVPTTCLLQDKHVEEVSPSNGYAPRFLPQNKIDEVECRYFARSYLAQFDEYLGKVLQFATSSGENTKETEVVEGIGAESCAKKCIEESCLAFHVCLDSLDGHVCELVKKQVRKTNLVPRKRCSTYVLSDKSVFNRMNGKLIDADPDQKAQDKGSDAPDLVVDQEKYDKEKKDIFSDFFSWFENNGKSAQMKQVASGFMSNLMILLMGAVTGVMCAFLWVRRDTVYNQATNLASIVKARF